MVRIRSLAKELRHLEKQKQAASTPSPPPAHTNPADGATPPSTAAALPRTEAKKTSSVSTTPVEGDSTHHAASPPAQTEEAVSCPSSSSPSPQTSSPHESAPADSRVAPLVNNAERKPEERGASSSASDEEVDESEETGEQSAKQGSEGRTRQRKNSPNLFAMGGSRFDILMNGSYGDGASCRKSEVRKATKVCSNGKDAIQRSQEDLMAAGEGAEGSAPRGAGDKTSHAPNTTSGVATTALAAPRPPAPPLGTSCGIPTRPPLKRLLPQPFSHILVCDFEATCASGSVHYPHEIIEFPVVVLDTATLHIVAEFHRYVKPVRNAKLTPFCTELTGITQDMVDHADTLPVVVEQFQQWLETDVYPLCAAWSAHYGPDKLSHNLKSEQKRFVFDDRTETAKANTAYEAMICVATDGPWDMRRFMHECSVMRDGIAFPPVCYRYINVRHCYSDHFKCRQIKLTHMLKKLSMSFEGRRHSGIDDTRNITRVLAELMARGYRVHHVSTIKYTHRGDAFLASNQAAQELLSEFGEGDLTHTSRHSNAHKNNAKRNTAKK